MKIMIKTASQLLFVKGTFNLTNKKECVFNLVNKTVVQLQKKKAQWQSKPHKKNK